MTSLPPMIVAEALGSIPDTIGRMLGERVLGRCLSAAELPTCISSARGHYLPEIALNRMLDTAARSAGDEMFGLTLAKRLSVREYGAWGDFVLEAPTLRSALRRAVSTIHLHANNDRLELVAKPATTVLEYTFAERTADGYRQVALAALGPMLSIPRHFKGPNWRPVSIGLDVGSPKLAGSIGTWLNTEVRRDSACISIEMLNADMEAANPSTGTALTMREDVVRACNGGPPRHLVPFIEQLVVQRLGIGGATLEEIARVMATSARSLQRHLDREGTNFRAVASAARMRRAAELLAGSSAKISDIAMLLDYATPSHFARAFRQSHGMSPAAFRSAGFEGGS